MGGSGGGLGGLGGVLGGPGGGPEGVLGDALRSLLGDVRRSEQKIALRRDLEASWDHLGPVLGRLGAVLGRLGAVLGPLWAVLGPSWGRLGASWGRLDHLDRPRQAKTGQDKVS